MTLEWENKWADFGSHDYGEAVVDGGKYIVSIVMWGQYRPRLVEHGNIVWAGRHVNGFDEAKRACEVHHGNKPQIEAATDDAKAFGSGFMRVSSDGAMVRLDPRDVVLAGGAE